MALQHTEDEDKTIYKVVVNHEEQYSIWPENRENPPGWRDAGKVGPKAECLAHIKEVWTDMRPLSLRKQMEELARNPPAVSPETPAEPRESLVDRLCARDHPAELCLRPESSVKSFKEALDNGYLRFKITDTEGGTELGATIDREASDLSGADFEQGTGHARVVGSLTLDFVKVRCRVDVDLATLTGQARLERVEATAV